MSSTRREFLIGTSSALTGVTAVVGSATAAETADSATAEQDSSQSPPPGTPPAFGTAQVVGPQITSATLAHAEKLVRIEMSAGERAQAAGNWRSSVAPLYERRTGPRKVPLDAGLAPGSQWFPFATSRPGAPTQERFVRGTADPGALPASESEIAFSPVWKLSRWIERRELTSERLTQIYLNRLTRFDPKLRCVITATPDLAIRQAKTADQEIVAGRYRGPLHGIPWGAKDLLDTAGIRTTYGAEPFRNRVPKQDAAVVQRLNSAGAVLVAKLSLGALALNDVWFGGQTLNPWLLDEGSGGSSAGPGAATAAGLVGFAIGSETEGSIIGPSMRCGVTGLRPTFGRVPRTGAMTLCWSLDKIGPMARAVEDTMLVLRAISGPDAGDSGSVPSLLDYDAAATVRGLRVGYFPHWMEEKADSNGVEHGALKQLEGLGLHPVEVSLPDWPYDSLNTILFAEAAAAFEELTLSRQVDQLKMQTDDAWPNVFRQARFISAVDFVQADRFRRLVTQEMARLLSKVDLLLVPSLRDEMMTIGNFTGFPSLTLRVGFVEVGEERSDWAPDARKPPKRFNPPRRVPHGITLIGRAFDEGTIARVGIALESALRVAQINPPGFQ
jgi:Asp-tRNA(Asn)/Glu-tRNA(Gln) amidotransferase A subunit family amidase